MTIHSNIRERVLTTTPPPLLRLVASLTLLLILGTSLAGEATLAASAAKSPDFSEFDVVGIRLGMTDEEVDELIGRMKTNGESRGIKYQVTKKQGDNCSITVFRATMPVSQAETNLTIFFSHDTLKKITSTIMVERHDKTEPTDPEGFRKALFEKYGKPAYMANNGSQLVWSEREANECFENIDLSNLRKERNIKDCGKRLIVSVSPGESISELHMLLKNEGESYCDSQKHMSP